MPKPRTTGHIKWKIVGDVITQTTTTTTVEVEIFSKRDILRNPKKYSQELYDIATGRM